MARRYKNSKRRKTLVAAELDITSLLDIITILLVFLVASYDSSGIIFNVPKGVSLPRSETPNRNTMGVVVQVSPETIWVDDKVVLESKESNRTTYDQGGRRITPLFDALVQKKELIKQTEMTAPNAKKFSGVVNLIVDKTIKYSYLKKLMYTCAEAGYVKYKLVVLGKGI